MQRKVSSAGWVVAAAIGAVSVAPVQASDAGAWAAIAQWPNFMGGIWGGIPAGGPAPFKGPPPSLTPKAQAMAAAFEKSSPEAKGAHSCEPDGIPTDVGGEFFFTKGEIFLMSDLDFFVTRQIFMKAQHDPDPDPTYYGDSIGHWEGDTLVVDSIAFLPQVKIANGVEGDGKTHVIERFRMTGPDTMQYTQIVENPEMFTKPWVAVRTLTRNPKWRVHETYCSQNNRDEPVSGQVRPDVTPPGR